mmetsp:Transcript_43840/g.80062  ORF Transcript_43840/g.80062 Transcript_43840/m.80062 type:complete len:289 (-) Transcript_43840:1183-2049(-)
MDLAQQAQHQREVLAASHQVHMCHRQRQLRKVSKCHRHQLLARTVRIRVLAKEIEEGSLTVVAMTEGVEEMEVEETTDEVVIRAGKAATTIAMATEIEERIVLATGTEVRRQAIRHSLPLMAMAMDPCHPLATHRCQVLLHQVMAHCHLAIRQGIHRHLDSQGHPRRLVCLRQAIGQVHHQGLHLQGGELRQCQVGPCRLSRRQEAHHLVHLAALQDNQALLVHHMLRLQQADHQEAVGHQLQGSRLPGHHLSRLLGSNKHHLQAGQQHQGSGHQLSGVRYLMVWMDC